MRSAASGPNRRVSSRPVIGRRSRAVGRREAALRSARVPRESPTMNPPKAGEPSGLFQMSPRNDPQDRSRYPTALSAPPHELLHPRPPDQTHTAPNSHAQPPTCDPNLPLDLSRFRCILLGPNRRNTSGWAPTAAPSSSGLGHRVFIPATGVRLPVGSSNAAACSRREPHCSARARGRGPSAARINLQAGAWGGGRQRRGYGSVASMPGRRAGSYPPDPSEASARERARVDFSANSRVT
jgi:hypothetical protein